MIHADDLRMRGVWTRFANRSLPAILLLAAAWLLAVPNTLQAAIPLQERQALIDLYNSTNGPIWINKTGWLGAEGTECSWYGVTCDWTNTNLQALDLVGNQLSGSIPVSLGNLSNLWLLDLEGNQLSGSIPSSLGNLTNLLFLHLSSNQLIGSIPSSLENLTKMWSLYLSSNQLSGSIPSSLGNLTHLGDLRLYSNQLSGSIPSSLGNLANLEYLDLGRNQLSGSIPSSLEKLTNLQDLLLNNNQLSGSIPAELGNLTNLGDLLLFSNQLSGNIPSSLGDLTNLQTLGLGGNQLGGSIPSSLGNLTNLRDLWLNNNQLSGSIPSSLGNLTNLQSLLMFSNQLSGNIPSSLGNLTKLQSVELNYNALYATDQSLLNFLNSMDSDWQGMQTVAPASLSAVAQSISSILMSWSPITYSSDSGRYEVYQGTTSGGPYVLAGSTADKTASSFTLTGLLPLTQYYIVVRTVTDPHTYNQNTVTSEYSDEVFAATTGLELSINAGGAAIASTAGGDGAIRAGYSGIALHSGTAPYGTAVFSFKQNGVTISEAGVPASPPTTLARIFIDYRSSVAAVPSHLEGGTVNINTGIAVVNQGSSTANVTYILRDADGDTISVGNGTIEAGSYFACFIDQLKSNAATDFEFPADFQTTTQFGSLEISGDQPLSILGLRGTNNQRNDFLMTTTPIADLTHALNNAPIYFPQFVDGGGYTTSLVLLNASDETESGSFQIMDGNGNPFVVNQAGGTADFSFTYSIPAHGVFHFQTDGSPTDAKAGWVRLTPDAGTSTPVGSGVFGYNSEGYLVSESGIPAAAATTHARVYVDLSNGHNTGLAISNVEDADSGITINAFEKDGVTAAGTSQGPIALVANGYAAAFADQFVTGLPDGFTGVLDISSSKPFAALTLRSLLNERHDFLMTTFPVADMNQAAPEPIVFPQIVDGGGYTTQFILISAGGAASTILSYYDKTGAPTDFGE